jgi:hypothetical protein
MGLGLDTRPYEIARKLCEIHGWPIPREYKEDAMTWFTLSDTDHFFDNRLATPSLEWVVGSPLGGAKTTRTDAKGREWQVKVEGVFYKVYCIDPKRGTWYKRGQLASFDGVVREWLAIRIAQTRGLTPLIEQIFPGGYFIPRRVNKWTATRQGPVVQFRAADARVDFDLATWTFSVKQRPSSAAVFRAALFGLPDPVVDALVEAVGPDPEPTAGDLLVKLHGLLS